MLAHVSGCLVVTMPGCDRDVCARKSSADTARGTFGRLFDAVYRSVAERGRWGEARTRAS